MTRNLFAMSAVIVLMSTVSAVAACSSKQSQQAMSCSEGTAYDAETQTCKPVVNS